MPMCTPPRKVSRSCLSLSTMSTSYWFCKFFFHQVYPCFPLLVDEIALIKATNDAWMFQFTFLIISAVWSPISYLFNPFIETNFIFLQLRWIGLTTRAPRNFCCCGFRPNSGVFISCKLGYKLGICVAYKIRII